MKRIIVLIVVLFVMLHNGCMFAFNHSTNKNRLSDNGMCSPIINLKNIGSNQQSTWQDMNLITNSDCEGSDIPNFFRGDSWNGLNEPYTPKIVVDPTDETNHCIQIETGSNPGAPNDTQFYITDFSLSDILYQLEQGADVRLSMRVRADKKQESGIIFQGEPNDHVYGPGISIDLGTVWNTVYVDLTEYYGILKYTQSDGGYEMHTITFNLAYLKNGNTCYFDDIKFEVMIPENSGEMVYMDFVTNGSIKWNSTKDDMTCFTSVEWIDGAQIQQVSRVVQDPETKESASAEISNYCIEVFSCDDPVHEYDTQFFVTIPKVLHEGDRYKFSMRVKAEKEATVSTQAHAKPCSYLDYRMLGDMTVTTKWTNFTYAGTITADQDGMTTIAFNLNNLNVANKYYFDDISFQVLTEKACANPVFRHEGNDITITCATNGATIYYTTDGSIPTTSSEVYSDPITVSRNCTIKAFAEMADYNDSEVVSYSVDWFKVATPTFSYNNKLLTIQTRTSGATIYYTTDGTTPTTSKTKYTQPILLSEDCIVKAMAVKSNFTNSAIATFEFSTADYTCEKPLLARDGDANRVVITCETPNAEICFTTDGSTPTISSAVYDEAIEVNHNCTIKAIATRSDLFASEVASLAVDWFQVAKPTFTFDKNSQKLSISTTTTGATIYYTTDGSKPKATSSSSTKYSGPIALSNDCTVKAIAVKADFKDSEMSSYKFTKEQCQTPQVTRDGETNRVVITSETENAEIYYTTDGSTPTTSSAVYNGAIAVDHNCIVKAIATRSDMFTSEVGSLTVDWFKVATPTLSYNNLQLAISTETEDATIYYTTNGSTPTTSSIIYTEPISLSSNCTIKAIAVKTNYTTSDVASFVFSKPDYTCKTPLLAREGDANRVGITSATDNAVIYYTTDGSAPTTSSAIYSKAIDVTKNCTVKAIATRSDMFTSEVGSLTVDWFKVATPTFAFNNMKLTICTETEDATIYYTTNGSIPTTSSTRYTEPIPLSEDCTIKAIAVKADFNNSEVATYTFIKYELICQAPQITRDGETNNIIMTCATEGASIYYTLDGSTPTTASTLYTGPVMMTKNCKVRAIATRSDLFPSEVHELVVDWIVIDGVTVDYKDGVLSIMCDIPNAEIHYEIGGKDATKESPLYTAPITLTDNREVRYVVYAEGYNPVSGSYIPTNFACAPVTMSYDGKNVELSTTESNATIYYTIDGTTPTTVSSVYERVITLTGLCAVKAFAAKQYKNNSNMLTEPITYFFDGATISMSEAGHVEDAMKWSGVNNITELNIRCKDNGVLNNADMTFIRTMRTLKHLNLSEAAFEDNIVPDGAFSSMNIVSIAFPSTVMTVTGNIFSGCSHLASIFWKAQTPMAITAEAAGINNPNLLLYVEKNEYAPQGIQNVIADGSASSIILTDASNGCFYCPQAFLAESISYTHTYSQTTGINECRGWETIALPFDVQEIKHEQYGKLAPFAANDATARSFWLAELGENGFKRAGDIKAYTPYIISMPNNDVYENTFIAAGTVTFGATNATIPVTAIKTASMGTHVFTPCFDTQAASAIVYVINKYDGSDAQRLEGSVFLPNYKSAGPFEAYISIPADAAAPRYIPIRNDDETGIQNIVFNGQSSMVNGVYDMTGRKVEGELQKGVYIINGKKVLLK